MLLTSGIALLAAATRTSSYPVALTRDTGQMLYGGMIVLHGQTPYTDATLDKGPTTYLFSAALRLIVGRSAFGVRLALLACAIVAALCLWRFLERVATPRSAAVAALGFAALSAIAIFEGEDPDLEQFAIAPMAVTLLLSSGDSLVSAGACGAVGAITSLLSPVFAIPLAPASIWAMWGRQGPWPRRILAATATGLAVCIAVGAWLVLGDALPSMGHQFAATGGTPPSGGLLSPHRLLTGIPAPGLWLASLAAGALALTQRRLRLAAIGALAWIALSWARVKFGDYFAHDPEYDHHYYPALIGMCSAVGLGIDAVWTARSRWVSALATVALGTGLIVPLVIVPEIDAYELPIATRGIGQNRWDEADTVAAWLDQHTAANAQIMVAGSEATVYWLADRFASSRVFDVYAISGYPPYLHERTAELNRDPPVAIAAVHFDPPDSSLARFIRNHGYRVAYTSPAGEVWLGPGKH